MGFSEKLKAKVKEKAHFLCCLCKSRGVEVHHIIPEAENGDNTEDNAAPLCPSCHDSYGANPQKRKFIKELRNFWYDLCKSRYSGDQAPLEEIKSYIRQSERNADLELQEENRRLRKKIKELEDKINKKDSVILEDPFYWRIDGDKRDGPFCTQCYDKEDDLIRPIDHKNGVWTCPTCKTIFEDRSSHDPSPHVDTDWDVFS